MKYARTFYGRCNNLLRTSTRTHKLEMKGFRYIFVLFGVLTVISHLIQSSDSSAHYGKEKCLQIYKFKRIREAFLVLHLSHQQQKIEAARNNMSPEGPGTGLAYPSIHLEQY